MNADEKKEVTLMDFNIASLLTQKGLASVVAARANLALEIGIRDKAANIHQLAVAANDANNAELAAASAANNAVSARNARVVQINAAVAARRIA